MPERDDMTDDLDPDDVEGAADEDVDDEDADEEDEDLDEDEVGSGDMRGDAGPRERGAGASEGEVSIDRPSER
jgi:hypothetical protein